MRGEGGREGERGRRGKRRSLVVSWCASWMRVQGKDQL